MEIPSRGLAGGKYSNIFTNLAHELSCVFHQETDGCPLWSPCVRYPLDRAGNELLSWQSIVDSFAFLLLFSFPSLVPSLRPAADNSKASCS